MKLWKYHDGGDYHEWAEKLTMAETKEEAAVKLKCGVEEVEEVTEEVYRNQGCDC